MARKQNAELTKIKNLLVRLSKLRERRAILWERCFREYQNTIQFWIHSQKHLDLVEKWTEGMTDRDIELEEVQILIRSYAKKIIEAYWNYYASQLLSGLVPREELFGPLGYEFCVVDAM